MNSPDTSVTPLQDGDNSPIFDEAWQAQVLAVADSLVQAKHITASQWAKALGDERRNAVACHAPDTAQTYYECALKALENLLAQHMGLKMEDLNTRKTQWEQAYQATPHGQPVKLAQ